MVSSGIAAAASGGGNPTVSRARTGRRGLAVLLAIGLGMAAMTGPAEAQTPGSPAGAGAAAAQTQASLAAADSPPASNAAEAPTQASLAATDSAPDPGAAAATAGSCSDPETRATSLRCFPRLLLHDAGAVLGAPAHWGAGQWTLFSLEVLGVGAVTLADKQVRKEVLPRQGTSAGLLAKDVEPLGGSASFGVLGAFYAGGAIAGDDKAKGVAIDGLIASAIASGVITTSLKYIVGRSRPNTGNGVYHFKPFSGDVSFPSGHATQAFAVASVIATEYPSAWVQVASYGPALLVGFARLRHDAHWASDVAAGALIGSGVGRAVARLDLPLRTHASAHHVTVVPILGPREQGIAVTASFE